MIQKLLFCTLFFIISFFSYGQSPQTFNSSGNFVVPPGVTSLTVEVWGAGGAGGGSTGGDSSAGGGGGGGAYTKNTSVPVLANASIPFIVGTGGIGGTTGNGGNGLSSSFLTVSAGGGFGGRGSVNGGTGGARGTGGTNGGNGADGNTYGPVALSGGGGGSAGSGGAGGNASDATGGNAGNIDGSAGAGGVLGGRIFGTSFGDNGSNGTSPGSGGSGGAGNNYVGGNGGNGQIRISWNCPVYTLTSPTTASSSCGSGKSTVRLTSTTLPNGTYNVTYSTTNPNSSGNTASMTFNAGTGTFLSKTLSATSTITVNSIEIGTAPSTCSFNVTSNNTATATVNTLPGAPTISASGPLTFCAGGSVTLTSSVATNNLWSTGATTPSITVSATGTYTVRAINTTTLCQSLPSAGTTVTVTPKPVINAMGTSACSGALFTAAPVDGTNGTVPATTTYTWTAPTAVTGLSGGIAGSGATITGTLTNSTNAALSTTYSVTPVTAGCTGTPFNLTVTVNPKPAINAMGTSACSGALFTATPANSTNGVVPATTTYTWTAPTAVTGLSGGVAGSGATITGTLTNSTNAALSTTYSVTPITAGCTGTPFNLTVTVNPTPAINAMGTSACSGALFTATPANSTNGVVPATTTYTWTAPTVVTGLYGGVAGSGATITGTLTNSTNAALSTIYSVTPVTAGCTGTPFNLTVTVNPTPAINAMGTSACSGALFTATPANSTNGVVPATTTYTWTAPTVVTGLYGGVAGSGATITGTLTNSTNAALSTIYSVTPVTAGCTGTPFNLTVTVNPTPAINAMGTSACSGALFTATPANSTNGVVPATTTYTWTAPTVVTGLSGGVAGSGATITGTLTNSTNAALSTTYSVTPVTAGCTGTAFNLTVTVNPTPAINAMATSACSGTLFTAAPANTTNGVVPATTTYTWTAPTVVTGLSGGVAGSGATITGTLTNSTNAALSTTYSVTPVTGGCTGTAFNLTVTVNPKPAINAMATSACSGTLFTAAPANTTNGVVPATTTYTWTAPTVVTGLSGGVAGSGASITGTLTNSTNAALSTTYSVTPVTGGCTGTAFNLTVTVNPKPAINAMATSACSGTLFTAAPANTTNGVVPATTTYTWTAPTVVTGLSGGVAGSGASITGTLTNSTNAALSTTYSVTPITGGCTGTAFNLTVTVNPTPTTPTISAGGPLTFCAGDSVTLTSSTGTTYLWSNGATTQSITVSTSGIYSVQITNAAGCQSAASVGTTVNSYAKTWLGLSNVWADGANWSPSGIPTNTDCVVISGTVPFQPETLPALIKINSITINNGGLLTIQSQNVLDVNNGVTVNAGGNLIFEDDSSLLQTNPNSINTGNIIYKRNTTPVRRYDYTYWSTPVTNTPAPTFKLSDLSPDTLVDKFFSYSPSSGWVYNNYGTQVMEPGMGYNVRAPQTFDINIPKIYNAQFTGIPNNGTIPVTPVIDKFILLGNPYPSGLDAGNFISTNNTGALYFWTHTSNPTSTGNGTYAYASADYATYTKLGGSGAGSLNFQNPPTGIIAAGQAFFIKATSATSIPIIFTNGMRVGAGNTQFYKTTNAKTPDLNRIWLNLTNKQGAFKQVLLGYADGATNSWDVNYDGPTMSGNSYVDFYSINDTKKLTIQGRALPFDDSDLVPFGYVTKVAGDFTIAIDHADGFFDTQAVYLEDKKTGKITDLRASNYTFTTAIGTFTDRFVLRYTNKTLGTGDFENVENGLLISVKNKVIKTTSSKEIIKDITIFDISGKVLYDKKKVGTTELEISNLKAADQVLLVKVLLENGYSTTRKIIF